MTKYQVVLLSGWLQSGKDTVGNLLVEKYGYKRYAFADALKDDLAYVLSIPREWMDNGEGKQQVVQGKTIRQHLIQYGQAQREKDALVWVKRVCQHIRQQPCPRIVITDWRLPNELQGVISQLGDSVQVISCRIVRWSKPPLQDYTEIALDNESFDYIINNSGTLQALEQQVESIFGKSDTIKRTMVSKSQNEMETKTH